MARFTTGVFVKAPTLKNALAQVSDLMKPYRKDNFYDEDKKWVSYMIRIAGRGSDGILLKDGSIATSAKVHAIQFDGGRQAYDEHLKSWDNIMVSPNPYAAVRKENLLRHYTSKQEYAKDMARFITHTFVTPTGDWFETGRLNPFGITSVKERDAERTYQQQWDKAIVDFDDCYFILLDCQNRKPRNN